jgi:hypothetical protein
MSGRDVAWTTAAATGLGCAVVAALAVWMLLTDPLAVTKALTAHDLSTLANTAAGALQDLAVRLLR